MLWFGSRNFPCIRKYVLMILNQTCTLVKLGLSGWRWYSKITQVGRFTKRVDIMLTGKIFSQEKLKIGLVDDVVNKNKLHTAATKLVKKLVSKHYKKKVKKSLMNKILTTLLRKRNSTQNSKEKS